MNIKFTNSDDKIIQKNQGKIKLILVHFGKYSKTWLPIIISFIAIWLSYSSERTAQNANQTASEALETSKYQFVQLNRPNIILTLIKYDNGHYWKVDQKAKIGTIELKYKMKNLGNVAAKNISMAEMFVLGFGFNSEYEAPVIFEMMGEFTLCPGEEHSVIGTMEFQLDNEESVKNYHEHINTMKSKGLTFQISVNYANELDESKQYKTLLKNKIHNDQVLIVKSEMITGINNKSE